MNSFERYQQSTSATFARRVQENPQNPELHFLLGLKFADEKELSRAIDSLYSALELHPTYVDAAMHLAKYCFKLQRYEEAELALDSIPDLGRYNGQREVLLGEISRLTGRVSKARSHYLNAISLGERRNHLVHQGLTTLLVAGVDMGIAAPSSPLLDERIEVVDSGRVVYARLRIFRDRLNPTFKVVLFTSEADEQDQGKYGLGVTNGAEMLINYVVSEPRFQVSLSKTTWVGMHEKTMTGLDPMHISQLIPVGPEELSQEPSWLVSAWKNFLGTVQPAIPDSLVNDIEFLPLSHSELEEMINFRFFWDC